MRALLFITIIALVILAIVNVVLRGNKHSRTITASMIALAAGAALMVSIEIFSEQEESVLAATEVDRHEYSQVLRWQKEFAELRPQIDTALADGNITWSEYYAIEREANLVPKRRLQQKTQ